MNYWFYSVAAVCGAICGYCLSSLGHKHKWILRGTNYTELGGSMGATNVLFSCRCLEPRTVVIHGKWSVEDIRGEKKTDEFARQMGIQL